jgi:hypothetical protein
MSWWGRFRGRFEAGLREKKKFSAHPIEWVEAEVILGFGVAGISGGRMGVGNRRKATESDRNRPEADMEATIV